MLLINELTANERRNLYTDEMFPVCTLPTETPRTAVAEPLDTTHKA